MLRATAIGLFLLGLLTTFEPSARADDPHPEMDKAIAPLFSGLPSESDLAQMKASIEAAYRDDIAGARAQSQGIQDPTARKLAEWYLLRNVKGAADPFALEKFRLKNPDWPANEIRFRTEEALLVSGGDPKAIVAMTSLLPMRARRSSMSHAVARSAMYLSSILRYFQVFQACDSGLKCRWSRKVYSPKRFGMLSQ